MTVELITTVLMLSTGSWDFLQKRSINVKAGSHKSPREKGYNEMEKKDAHLRIVRTDKSWCPGEPTGWWETDAAVLSYSIDFYLSSSVLCMSKWGGSISLRGLLMSGDQAQQSQHAVLDHLHLLFNAPAASSHISKPQDAFGALPNSSDGQLGPT